MLRSGIRDRPGIRVMRGYRHWTRKGGSNVSMNCTPNTSSRRLKFSLILLASLRKLLTQAKGLFSFREFNRTSRLCSSMKEPSYFQTVYTSADMLLSEIAVKVLNRSRVEVRLKNKTCLTCKTHRISGDTTPISLTRDLQTHPRHFREVIKSITRVRFSTLTRTCEADPLAWPHSASNQNKKTKET